MISYSKRSITSLIFKGFFKNLYEFFYYPFCFKIQSGDKNYEFIEEAEFEKGFKDFFDKNIRKFSEEIRKKREIILKKIILRYRIFLALTTVFCFYFSEFWNFFIPYHQRFIQNKFTGSATLDFCVFVIIFLQLIRFLIHLDDDYEKLVKNKIFTTIFEQFYGFKYDPKGTEKPLLYSEFHIFDSFDDSNSETSDLVSGVYCNVRFSFEELKLTKVHRRSNKQDSLKEVFAGHVIKLGFNKKFKSLTIVKSDKGSFLNAIEGFTTSFASKLKKVSLEDPNFEKIFEVYSEDQIEARYLLSPAFMERLKNLSNFYGKSAKIQASFFNEDLLLAFSNFKFDMFKPTPILKEFNIIRDCKTVIKHVNLIFEVISSLKIHN